ncbi:hypothetical protein C8Q70DRAFT_271135 [Cubamyces menziesii]|uniref:CFEM domain-containing protein n=1 Tax=Trametes cubensis TaxID=1111947 RepID=A0AAD7TX03_9APHY|nr:hypothetical protein C8Q70DRAFT_271135 [Cubamyces menziesii]KAJ8487824.1 hypothetical protein ONZ51_g3925 [Trametes cubensis]
MRFFAVIALATAVSASAAGLHRRQTGYPDCANPCLLNADFGSCDPVDDNCLCHSQSFVSSVTNCVVTSCSGADLTQAETAAQQACAAVGVTLSSSAAGAQTSATTGTPASTGSTTATATTSVTSTPNAASSRSANAIAALAAVGAAALIL